MDGTAGKIAAAYAADPDAVKLYSLANPDEKHGLEASLEELAREKIHALTPDAFMDSALSAPLTRLLGSIDPGRIVHDYGEEVLYGVWMQHASMPLYDSHQACTDQLIAGLGQLTGRDTALLLQAYRSVRQDFAPRRHWPDKASAQVPLEALHHRYHFLEQMHNGALGAIPLEELITGHQLPGNGKIPDAADYELMLMYPRCSQAMGAVETWGLRSVPYKEGTSKMYEVFLDGPCGIGLMYQGEPNAVSSFHPVHDNTLMLFQHQGVSPDIWDKNMRRIGRVHSPPGLNSLDWKGFFVDFVERLARNLGYGQSAIQGSENNAYTTWQGNPDTYLPPKKAVKIYDETADRLNYVLEKDGNWYKRL